MVKESKSWSVEEKISLCNKFVIHESPIQHVLQFVFLEEVRRSTATAPGCLTYRLMIKSRHFMKWPQGLGIVYSHRSACSLLPSLWADCLLDLRLISILKKPTGFCPVYQDYNKPKGYKNNPKVTKTVFCILILILSC